MSRFVVYQAAAGSGKTYALVRAYLQEALQAPKNFQAILAITFTNAATAALKTRLLTQLRALSLDQAPELAAALANEQGWTNAEVQSRAQAALSTILHHYGDLRITTIDAFFQQVVRVFAQEIGLKVGLRVELNQEQVISSLVESTLQRLEQYPALQQWLVDLTMQRLAVGRNWDTRQLLTTLGIGLLSEDFRRHEAGLIKFMQEDGLNRLRMALQYQVDQFEKNLRQWGEQVQDILRSTHFSVTDFAYGHSGVMGYLMGLVPLRQCIPTRRVRDAMSEVDRWCSKTHKQREMILALVKAQLQPLLHQVITYYDTHGQDYHTAQAALQQVYALGIHTDLLQGLQDYREEYASLLVSDAPLLLHKLLVDNEVPFVYEKLGTRYRHFLIDEFQDVSALQWENLKPLVTESVAQGYTSQVVGDAKQAIYRWRGGDAQLLLQQIAADVGQEHTVVKQLDCNWRSQENIVAFNNTFFPQAGRMLQGALQTLHEAEADPVLHASLTKQVAVLFSAYGKASQRVPMRHKAKGVVQIQFLEAESPDMIENQVINRTVRQLEFCQRMGYRLEEIALLVRNHREARTLAEALWAHRHSSAAQSDCSYDVVLAAGRQLRRCPEVHLVVYTLRWLAGVDEKHAARVVAWVYRQQQGSDTLAERCVTTASTPVLPPQLVAEKTELRQMPLYVLVMRVVELLGFVVHKLPESLASFLAEVWAFCQRAVPLLTEFLDWWEETQQYQATLPAGREQAAMPIMTIHQAKGLQFKVVLLPFCNWHLDHHPQQSQLIWCKTPTTQCEIYPPVMPLFYQKSLLATHYHAAYHQERIQAYFDNLNLLYVALTRAEEAMYAFIPKPRESARLTQVSSLLHRVVTNDTPPELAMPEYPTCILKEHWDAGSQVLALG